MGGGPHKKRAELFEHLTAQLGEDSYHPILKINTQLKDKNNKEKPLK